MQEFTYSIRKALVVGLRPSEQNKRGEQALVQAAGVFPREGALVSVEPKTTIDISSISPAPTWPFPQIFALKTGVIVCTETAIYEYDEISRNLTFRIGDLTPGSTWTVADFHNFLVLTNGQQLVFRGGASQHWTVTNDYGLPVATSVLNYKGQLIFTAPLAATELPLPFMDFSDPNNSMYL